MFIHAVVCLAQTDKKHSAKTSHTRQGTQLKPHKTESPSTALQNKVQAGDQAWQDRQEVSTRQGPSASGRELGSSRAPDQCSPPRWGLRGRSQAGGLVRGDSVGGACLSAPGGGQVESGAGEGLDKHSSQGQRDVRFDSPHKF